MTVNEGKKAPIFTLPDAEGKKVSLEDFRGKTIVLYFYPKDDTPGCTTQACDFRDSAEGFSKNNIVIIGVSPDSPESHRTFIEKYELPFVLLADEKKTVAKKYGAFGEKNMYGKKVEGMIRSTFVIDPDGVVKKTYRNVRAKGHVERVLKDIG